MKQEKSEIAILKELIKESKAEHKIFMRGRQAGLRRSLELKPNMFNTPMTLIQYAKKWSEKIKSELNKK